VKVVLIFLEARRNPAEMLAFREATLNPVALFIERFVIGPWCFAVGFGWDHRDGSGRFDILHNGVGIITFVGQHRTCWSIPQQRNGLRAVGGLPGGEHKVHRLAQLIAQQMNFGR
jgi:hypothetical protein